MGLWIPPIFAAEVHFESRLVAARLIETHQTRAHQRAGRGAAGDGAAEDASWRQPTRPCSSGLPPRQGIRAWKRWWRFRDVHREFGLKFWALISGGGALGGPLEQFWNALGLVVIQGYGMTETSALITLNHPFHVARGTIGKPLPGREVKLGPDGEVLVRGPMISDASWQGGAMQPRHDEWLATGDLAETQPSGELRFVGRKSEVIVTAAGVNLHPEDLEAAVEQQPDVAACAVVAMETATGPEACAVLAMRGSGDKAAAAIEHANRKLAEFQRLKHWVLWPEPDLPRTSTGKVRRKAVAAWLAEIQAAAATDATTKSGDFDASTDWLLRLIAEISGERPAGGGDELRLSEDLQLDSLGRVQLAAALEERLGMTPESGLLEEVGTLGELRALVAGATTPLSGAVKLRQMWGTQAALNSSADATEERDAGPSTSLDAKNAPSSAQDNNEASVGSMNPTLGTKTCQGWGTQSNNGELEAESEAAGGFIYPRWPWLGPVQWVRAAFVEAVAQPLVALLADPRVVAAEWPASDEPMLIVANHVTSFDGPLIQYALPGRVRRRMAAAMAGEMLEEYRHFRNPESGKKGFFLLGPLYLSAADGALQRLSTAAATELPAQLSARRLGAGSRIQCAGLSRRHALGRGGAGELPGRNRAAGKAIGSQGAAGGDSRAGRAEGRQPALVPLRQNRSACRRTDPLFADGERDSDYSAAARCGGRTVERQGTGNRE